MDNAVQDNVMVLINAIDSKLKKVHTQSLDLSFNELLDMFKNKELDIAPDYQRLFQWSEGARSRFIESLLLEMPVPPIYVIEEESSRYLLIDGLQRISSYLHLRGELDAPHLDPPVTVGQKLTFIDCDIVTELNGRTYDEIGTALQIRLKRAFIRVEVVRKGSDSRFKYWMFKRLNTGGQQLNEQQIRNCSIRLLNSMFIDFIKELTENDDFKSCIELVNAGRKIAAFDEELILRFYSFKNNLAGFSHDVSDFLTEYMEAVSDPAVGAVAFNYIEEKASFDKTFGILNRTLGDRSFAYANRERNDISRGFSVYHFEAFTVGLQPHLHAIDLANPAQLEKVGDVLRAVKLNPEFIRITTGGGKNSPGPLKARINFVQDRIGAAL